MPLPVTTQILVGDALSVLRELPDEHFHCCVTSPPYWGLRDYGTGRWEGGDPTCDHRSPTMQEGREEDRPMLAGSAATNSGQLLLAHFSACGKCGARKVDSQIGLEPTVEEYVEKLVSVFREVRRVLRSDGTLWLNLGDSWNVGTNARRPVSPKSDVGGWQKEKGIRRAAPGLKPKDLVGAPWQVALALRADGWWLRSEIIWAKPNPMPESVTDRPTRSHETVFLLSKSRRYYYDAEAVREPAKHAGKWVRTKGADGMTSGYDGNRTREGLKRGMVVPAGRNLRDVWTIATRPFKGAHFATFPPNLVRPCVLAGTSAEGSCAACGAPRERVVEKVRLLDGEPDPSPRKRGETNHWNDGEKGGPLPGHDRFSTRVETVGWRDACSCGAGVEPCRVLDPFAGAGTVGVVAGALGRDACLIELNPEYAEMARRRVDGK